MKENHLTVKRKARYFTLGKTDDDLQEIWFVCHGYGQLAEHFIKNFVPLQEKHRLIVAPEALSRFYLQGTGGRIGATWMTREDRLNDINDYVNYLDSLYEHLLSNINQQQLKIIILGFSQGCATVCRWMTQSNIRADHLILWAGEIPPELDFQKNHSLFQDSRLSIVLGDQDEYAQPGDLEAQKMRLETHHIPYQFIPFKGGHHLNSELLKQLANTQ